jgi:epoxide hydrolase-like predicted phosphatase
MTIRAVFFDLGGVILRTEYQAPREHLAERLNMTYEDLNKIVFESESARLASVGAISTDKHWATVVRRLGLPAPETKTVQEEFFAGDVLDLGLVDYIRLLRPRHRTGLISNGWPDLRDYLLKHHLEDAFDALIISAEVGVMKPQPEIYHMALEQLRAKPDEAAFVDDTITNVEAARNLGMKGILFRKPEQALNELNALLR